VLVLIISHLSNDTKKARTLQILILPPLQSIMLEYTD
jgi:hypothetical protein